jgi:hypothetical protein
MVGERPMTGSTLRGDSDAGERDKGSQDTHRGHGAKLTI